MNTVTLKCCFKFLTLKVCITCYAKEPCICTVGQIQEHLLLSKQFLILSWLPDPINMGSKWDSIFDIIDNLQWYKDIYSLCRPDLSISPQITTISDLYLDHLILKVWIFKWDFKINIIDNLLWYKDKYLICRPDVGTSLYIKAIFDFRLDYLIQNLDFEVGLATWRPSYIAHIVANLGSLTCSLTL